MTQNNQSRSVNTRGKYTESKFNSKMMVPAYLEVTQARIQEPEFIYFLLELLMSYNVTYRGAFLLLLFH